MIHGQISQHLAVNLNPGLMQGTHQLRIRHTFQTGSSIDTLNPQSAEVSLLILTVAERNLWLISGFSFFLLLKQHDLLILA